MKLNYLLFSALLLVCSCSPKIKPANTIKLVINVGDSQVVKTFVEDCLSLSGTFKYIEHSQQLVYKAPPFTILGIDSKLYYLLQPDEITVNKFGDSTSITFKEKSNEQFNLFYQEFQNNKMEITSRKPMYINDNKDSLIENYYFAEQYASEFDRELNELIDSFAVKYKIGDDLKMFVKNDELVTRRIQSSYVTVKSFFPEFKKEGILVSRLLWYLNRFNKADKQSFLNDRQYYNIFEITSLITGRSVRLDKTPEEIAEHVAFLKKYLKPGDPAFQYFITVLYARAKNQKMSFASVGMKDFRKMARKSAYRDLYKTYVFNHKQDYLENNPAAQNYFDEKDNEYTLSSVLEPYDNKPVILDFWAS